MSHQIGGAVHTAGLVEQLRDAQGRLVIAREQERRRLRSDLHDGLGPALAGMGFQLDASRTSSPMVGPSRTVCTDCAPA